MTDDELMGYFEAQQEPPGGFHHREHVRVAWVYLRRAPLPVALERFRTGLRRFAEAHGKPERYHETITSAYVLLIAERMQESAGTWETFARSHPDLLAWSPSILGRYYRPETLKSERARREFVAPDVRPADIDQMNSSPRRRCPIADRGV